MTAEVRPATPEDAAIVALLGRMTFAEAFGYLFRNQFENDLRAYLDATFDVTKIERSLGKPENAYWLALWEKLPVGYAKLKCPVPPSATAQLQKMYVLGEFIGCGIGRDLIERVVTEAAASATAVWLDVLQENHRAIGFYRHHGFVVTGEHRFAIGAQQFLFQMMSRAVG